MTQLTTPFKLRASKLAPDAAVTPTEDLPAEVAGTPASYFWKDVIHSGNYVHPAREFSLAVNRERLARWAETGQQMLAAGVAIPINCDHSDSARDVVGYVRQFKLDGDRLLGLCQFIGDDAALMAARNLVSVGIDPDFTDGEARQWGEAVVHLALTPVPVVPDQDQFVQVGDEPEGAAQPHSAIEPQANVSPSALPCTPEQFQTLRDLIGDDVAQEDCVARMIERMQSPSDGNTTELAAAREEIIRLSANLPQPMPPEAEAAIAESARAKFDLAVERGSLSPIARDQLVATLVRAGDGKPNVMTLSRTANPGGDRCLAMAVADVLLDNAPVPLGERTGLQAMSRQIPGDESSPIDQLRSYMTKIASVSG